MRTKHTKKNPSFFDIDKIFNDHFTKNNKKLYSFILKCDFKIFYNNEFSNLIHIETDFYDKNLLINLKRYLLRQTESYLEKAINFLLLMK